MRMAIRQGRTTTSTIFPTRGRIKPIRMALANTIMVSTIMTGTITTTPPARVAEF